MKKYGPYIAIFTVIILTIWNIIDKVSFIHHIPSLFIIAAMIFLIYENRKKTKKNSN